jgi:DNA-binding CsgD family transcriptional regulator
VLVVDLRGNVELCTRLARRLLERYFPSYKDPTTLPPPLVHWLGSDPAAGQWKLELAESRLEVRRFAPPDPGEYVMLLLEEKVPEANSPARLRHLGLTASEADVLYWAAHGKSNQEVALILSKTLNTIKKHVANLIVKMGVDTRLMAALQAAEILELKMVEPSKLRSLRENEKLINDREYSIRQVN